jgi:ribosome-associated protein
LKAQALARAIAGQTLAKKASDVLIMDLRGLTSMADYFVVCSADSDTQVKAIAAGVEDGMAKAGVRPWHSESGSTNWILLDFVDVVLHVFHKTTRPFYSLERLWGDAKMERLADEPVATARRARTSRRKAKTSTKPRTTKRKTDLAAKKSHRKKPRK